jgi:hypothetical protein
MMKMISDQIVKQLMKQKLLDKLLLMVSDRS